MARTYFKLALASLAIVAAIGLSEAQRFAPGYCPTVTAHENFDKTKFFGNWIEVEKTPSIFDLMMRCLVVDYSDDQDNTVNVVVRGISLAGLPLTVNGDGLLQDVHRAGFYSIRYGFGVPFQGTLTTIIDTDYDDYAVVYSCTNSLLSGVFHSEYVWVLSRSGKISNPTRQNIYEKLDKLGINRSGLTMSDRASCPTNQTNVGRESDKDLASQGVVALGEAGAVAAPGSQEAGSKDAAAQVQKSNTVPLLYDLPSPASSSSVGSLKPVAKAPPAPVENKVQLPLAVVSSSVNQQSASPKIAAAPAVPVVSGVSAPSKPIVSQQSAPASNAAIQASPSSPVSSSSQQKPINSQQSPPAAQSSIRRTLVGVIVLLSALLLFKHICRMMNSGSKMSQPKDPTILPYIRDGRGHMSNKTKMINFYDRMNAMCSNIKETSRPSFKVPPLNVNEDKLYGNMPPIEIEAFLNIPANDAQAHNIDFISEQDILVARIKDKTDSKLVLEPVAFEAGKKRCLIGRSSRLDIICSADFMENSVDSYGVREFVRVVVTSVIKSGTDPSTIRAEVLTSMLAEHLPMNMIGQISLGRIGERDIPKYMQKRPIKDKISYFNMIKSYPGFNNPLSTEYLVQRLGIQDPDRYTLLGSFSQMTAKPEHTAVRLRATQLQAWAQPYIDQGIAQFNSNQLHLAKQAFDKALELYPTCVRALVSRGSVFKSINQFENALSDYMKAYRIDKSEQNKRLLADCFYEYGQRVYEAEDWSTSKKFFEKAIQYDPEHQPAIQFSRLARDKEFGSAKTGHSNRHVSSDIDGLIVDLMSQCSGVALPNICEPILELALSSVPARVAIASVISRSRRDSAQESLLSGDISLVMKHHVLAVKHVTQRSNKCHQPFEGVIYFGVSYDAANCKLTIWWHSIIMKLRDIDDDPQDVCTNWVYDNDLLTSNIESSYSTEHHEQRPNAQTTQFAQYSIATNGLLNPIHGHDIHNDGCIQQRTSNITDNCELYRSSLNHSSRFSLESSDTRGIHCIIDGEKHKLEHNDCFPESISIEVELISAHKTYRLRHTKICGPYRVRYNRMHHGEDKGHNFTGVYNCYQDSIHFNNIKSRDILNTSLSIRLLTTQSIFGLRKPFAYCFVNLAERPPHQQETRLIVHLTPTIPHPSKDFIKHLSTVNDVDQFKHRQDWTQNLNQEFFFDNFVDNSRLTDNLNSTKEAKLFLCIKYNGTTGLLNVTVVRATNLRSTQQKVRNGLNFRTTSHQQMRIDHEKQSMTPKLAIKSRWSHLRAKIKITSALKSQSNSHSAISNRLDSYVELILLSPNLNVMDRARTKLCTQKLNPIFMESFSFPVTLFHMQDITLLVLVHDRRSTIGRLRTQWTSLPTADKHHHSSGHDLIGWLAFGAHCSSDYCFEHWNDILSNLSMPISRWHILQNEPLTEPWNLFNSKTKIAKWYSVG
ncbi:Apolipoprotein D [Fragariocoptes setiger]|uniref:Apolipoprotein D n=1 Tax=Fragariocoptes setiger TaxID=1670756 RepID=A0ABQ7SB86_9ACAR|nr:Apolipoprotein D [Fragariocoptes setiger]